MKALIGCILWVTALPLVAQEAPTREELVQEFARAISTGTDNERSFQANGFHIDAGRSNELGGDLKPSGNTMDMLIVTSDSTFKVAIEKGRKGMSLGGGLALFHRQNGQPILAVGDQDGDGRLDGLTYSVVDEKGDSVMDVTDYEVDGQADVRIHFKDRYTEIWHIDRWYRIVSRDEARGILVDGKFVALRREKNRWIVQ